MIWLTVLILGFGLLARSLQRHWLTGPILFVAGGLLCASVGGPGIDREIARSSLHQIAEITLALLLFSDAATVRLAHLRGDAGRRALRLLLLGLPLVAALGTAVAWWVFPGAGWWSAALLAAVLSPTDAALGLPLVTDKRVPEQIRETITVESGLNDGMVLPLVVILATLVAAEGEAHVQPLFFEGLRELVIGPAVGLVAGLLGGRGADAALRAGMTRPAFEQFSGPALALLAFGVAERVGGNGFVAAFVAGLCFGFACTRAREPLREFAEAEGELLSFITFFLFAVLLLWPRLGGLEPSAWIYAVASLSVIRMAPVFAVLAGTGTSARDRLLYGWFGPRGIASVLFLVMLTEGGILLESGEPGLPDELMDAAVLTVALSVAVHGVSAVPLARLWSSRD